MSEELLTYFSSVETLRHSGRINRNNCTSYFSHFIFAGGHFVPATGVDKKVFVNFLMKMQSELAIH